MLALKASPGIGGVVSAIGECDITSTVMSSYAEAGNFAADQDQEEQDLLRQKEGRQSRDVGQRASPEEKVTSGLGG